MNFEKELAGFSPRQMVAIKALDDPRFKYLLYGGALGGGKSYLLRWGAVRQLMILASKYNVKAPVGMIACENYPSLKDRQITKMITEFPRWLGKLHNDHKAYGRCYVLAPEFGGGVIALRNLDDTSKYQSAEFAFIFVDESTKNKYEIFTFLRTRLRFPGVPDNILKFMGATNPGSIGHGWHKALWIDRIFADEWKGFEDKFHYIPSKAVDNPHLDAEYYRILNTLPEALREAFVNGSWDMFIGQAFTDFNKKTHVLKNSTPIPRGAQCYMTYDWGWGKPFSIGWWYIDGDGRLIRFDEWYGWNGTPNEGVRMVDSAVAKGIKQREKQWEVNKLPREFLRIAGNDVFNKKPDYRGGGQGKSTSEVFSEHGIYLNPGDSLRVLKIRQFRERLKIQDDGKPMMMVYERCKQFIRTIPDLVMEQRTMEDIDSNGEDHVYDEACNLCMARPMIIEEKKSPYSEVDKRIIDLEKSTHDTYDQYQNDMNDRIGGLYGGVH